MRYKTVTLIMHFYLETALWPLYSSFQRVIFSNCPEVESAVTVEKFVIYSKRGKMQIFNFIKVEFPSKAKTKTPKTHKKKKAKTKESARELAKPKVVSRAPFCRRLMFEMSF